MSNDIRPVSIIIPVYNIEEVLLRRCVESVVNQTYDALEVVLVDDGSSDGTADVCDRLLAEMEGNLKDGKSMRVFHKANGGSSSARNYGLDRASGEYMGFVDCDDYIDVNFVSLMMDAIVRHDTLMAQISRDEIAEDGSRLPDVCIPPQKEYVITAKEQMRELLMHRGDCSFCTRLTHRSLFEGLRFPEGKLNEDLHLLVNMLPLIDRYVILPDQAYHVFYRTGSNSRSGDSNVFRTVYMDIVENADMIGKIVADRYPELTKEAVRFGLFQRLEYMLHVPIGMMTKDNGFYVSVTAYLKRNIGRMMVNPYLTGKNKLYLLLLTLMPRTTRIVHSKIKKIA